MTYYPVQSPYPIFSDDNGTPLEDGYIYIGEAYQNPITNPVTISWDTSGLYPAAQPVRTIGGYPDRNGSPGIIYFNAGAFEDYSILVRDKHGNQVFFEQSARSAFGGFGSNSIDVIDDLRAISGFDEPIYVRGHTTVGDGGQGTFEWFDGAAPGTYVDDNGITIVPTGGDGSGAWIRNFKTTIKTEWYGIDTTGATDVSTILNQIVVACGTEGMILQFSAGTFLLEAESILLEDNIHYRGSGIDETIIKMNDPGVSGFSRYGTPTEPVSQDGITISDLTVDGNYNSVADGGDDNYQIGIYFQKVQYSKIYNVKVINTWYPGIEVYDNAENNRVYDCILENSGDKLTSYGFYYYAIGVDSGCDYCVVEKNRIVNCGGGIHLRGAPAAFYEYNIKLLHNVIISPTKYGIYIDDVVDDIIVDGNYVYQPGTNGIKLNFNTENRPSNPKIINNIVDGPNQEEANDTAGIYCTFRGFAHVTGNTVINSSETAGQTWGIITTGQGVQPDGAIVANNTLEGTFFGKYAIEVGTQNTIVSNNHILGDGTGTIAIRVGTQNDANIENNMIEDCLVSYSNIGTRTRINGYIDWNGDTISTSGIGEDDLRSTVIGQNYHLKYRNLKIEGAGQKTGAGGTKTLKLYFGSSSYTFHAAANNTNTWRVEATIIFYSGAQQNITIVGYDGTTITQNFTAWTENLTAGDITLKITGECANAGDTITQSFWRVESY